METVLLWICAFGTSLVICIILRFMIAFVKGFLGIGVHESGDRMEEVKTHMKCSRCGKEEERGLFFGYYEDRMRTTLSRYCRFEVDPDAYNELCESCKEWYMYHAVEGTLSQEQVRYLKGNANEQEKTPDV